MSTVLVPDTSENCKAIANRNGMTVSMYITKAEERILMRLRQQPGRRWLLNHAKGTLALVGRDEECDHTYNPVLPTG